MVVDSVMFVIVQNTLNQKECIEYRSQTFTNRS